MTYSLADYQKKLEDQNLVKRFIQDEALLAMQVFMIAFDSRYVQKNTIFVCKGKQFKYEFLQEAFQKGAFCFVSENDYSAFPGIIVTDIRKAMAVLANMFYEEAWRSFPLIGLTGTKGKSTTVYFIRNIIDRYNFSLGKPQLGYLSSIQTFDGAETFESHLTTPEALTLAKHFDNVRKSGLYGMIMEVSSQALKYDRTLGVEFDIGCFLNFGIDHIGESEHPDIEDYFSSKLKFFDQCKTVCLNLDTDRLPQVMEAIKQSPLCKKLITYSPSGAQAVLGVVPDYVALDVRKEEDEIIFRIVKRQKDQQEKGNDKDLGEFKLTMPGFFNVENALLAAVVCFELGFPPEAIRDGLYDAAAAGRMEVFKDDERELVVIVDYAHNRMSFESLFSSTQLEYPGWRIEALFGCPGGKGVQRRVELPEVASRYADFVWVTEEDAGEESLEELSQQLYENLQRHGCPAEIVNDREEAISRAIKNAPKKTVILMTGKGREPYQKRGKEYVDVESDVQLVEKYLL
ncbi:MAG: UDP-N-acetylmuramyl-tripeptide synthetase [Clostridia bacterium]|nr:UDP-N-acetylmuramyl-tripeptide synthetase [Clostridia bacterium]